MNLKVENRVKILQQYLKMAKSNLRTQMILQNLLKAMRLRLAIIKRESHPIQMSLKVQPNLSSKMEKASKQRMVVYQ
jgi:hypothetical protein